MADVYQMADLESRAVLDAGAAKPARLAVVGCPIAHSASPVMQQAALDLAGLDMRYIRLEVPPGRVGEALARMRGLGFIGCNVTVPHKLEVMAACAAVEPSARLLGAVNTVRFDDGGPRGFNTDGPGFVRAVEADFGVVLAGRRVVLLGAGGGAGQALAVQCALAGVAGLVLVNRTVAKLDPLVLRLREAAPDVEVAALGCDDPALAAAGLAADLVVNASSLGLRAGDAAAFPEHGLRAGQWVYDCVYLQQGVTPLLALAAARGCQVADGRSMLVFQGALAFERWFGQEPSVAVMRAALGR